MVETLRPCRMNCSRLGLHHPTAQPNGVHLPLVPKPRQQPLGRIWGKISAAAARTPPCPGSSARKGITRGAQSVPKPGASPEILHLTFFTVTSSSAANSLPFAERPSLTECPLGNRRLERERLVPKLGAAWAGEEQAGTRDTFCHPSGAAQDWC